MNATKRLLTGILVLGGAALVLPAWAQAGGMHGMMGDSNQRMMGRTMMSGGMGQGCTGSMMQSMGMGSTRPNQQWQARRHAAPPEDPDRTVR